MSGLSSQIPPLTQRVMRGNIGHMSEDWFDTAYLINAIVEAGIVRGDTARIKAIQWISKAEKAGKILPHKIHTHSGTLRRKFRATDIEEIVAAFSVGGSGYWRPKPI
jgi:hypothetical protein